MPNIVVSALYKFATLEDFSKLRKPLLQLMQAHQVKGSLLLAKEGVNGTIAGSQKGIDAVIDWLRSDPRLANIQSKESYTQEMPFYRTKVKLKKEIVSMGVASVNTKNTHDTYIKPQDWNVLISEPEVLLIDTRNDYEVQIGSFKNAINPAINTFHEFPDYVRQHLNAEKHKKIAMYCTGGIRCEKSTAYLKEQGFDKVYQLQGGVLGYLAEIPVKQSLWQGECFIFDNRVAINHDLKKGRYDQCYACRYPITEENKRSEYYAKGVSCPHCYNKVSQQQRQRFAEREKQVQLAKQRGEEHIGTSANNIFSKRRALKYQQKAQQREKALPQEVIGKQTQNYKG